jgi:hypothetical protein
MAIALQQPAPFLPRMIGHGSHFPSLIFDAPLDRSIASGKGSYMTLSQEAQKMQFLL